MSAFIIHVSTIQLIRYVLLNQVIPQLILATIINVLKASLRAYIN